LFSWIVAFLAPLVINFNDFLALFLLGFVEVRLNSFGEMGNGENNLRIEMGMPLNRFLFETTWA
jgi:hypothetical protein